MLQGKKLEGYGHAQILWWAEGCDNDKSRSKLIEEKPYKNGPDEIGAFATRSPERPNPIAVSNSDIAYVDVKKGVIGLYYIDAFDGTEGTLNSRYLDQMKEMAIQCEEKGIALDYYPTNFIVHDNSLVYIGCKYYELTENNYYEKKGQLFWMNAPALIAGIVTERMKENFP